MLCRHVVHKVAHVYILGNFRGSWAKRRVHGVQVSILTTTYTIIHVYMYLHHHIYMKVQSLLRIGSCMRESVVILRYSYAFSHNIYSTIPDSHSSVLLRLPKHRCQLYRNTDACFTQCKYMYVLLYGAYMSCQLYRSVPHLLWHDKLYI